MVETLDNGPVEIRECVVVSMPTCFDVLNCSSDKRILTLHNNLDSSAKPREFRPFLPLFIDSTFHSTCLAPDLNRSPVCIHRTSLHTYLIFNQASLLLVIPSRHVIVLTLRPPSLSLIFHNWHGLPSTLLEIFVFPEISIPLRGITAATTCRTPGLGRPPSSMAQTPPKVVIQVCTQSLNHRF